MRTNLQQHKRKLMAIRSAVVTAAQSNFSDMLFHQVNAVRGLMNRRIFNEGLDANGGTLGDYHGRKTRLTSAKYSKLRDDEYEEKNRKKIKREARKLIKNDPDSVYTEYEKKRITAGRQISRKDLEFSGSLQKSIETVRKENIKVVIEFSNIENAKLAKYQEQQIANIRSNQNARTGKSTPVEIFTLSKEEYDRIRTEGNRAIRDILKRTIRL